MKIPVNRFNGSRRNGIVHWWVPARSRLVLKDGRFVETLVPHPNGVSGILFFALQDIREYCATKGFRFPKKVADNHCRFFIER
jgi:hypothetical protein